MTLKIEINLDNAAFGETPKDRGEESIRVIARVLDMLASAGAHAGEYLPLFDTNGNRVGAMTIE